MLDGIYEITLYATNATPLLQRIKLLPPEKYKQSQLGPNSKYPPFNIPHPRTVTLPQA